MVPIMEAAAVLKNVSGIDWICPYNLSDEAAKDVESTAALLTEVFSNVPGNHASDAATTFSNTIEINIFYGLSKSDKSPEIEQAIFDAFEKSCWYQTGSGSHILDPDTNQLSITKQFSKTKERF